ncbi:MAG: ribonuclease HI family protein [Candidatus Pacebacteria bacterium]|nr:ribonuclease HI family protein [Candidatus Paceibacterota bacterium]
MPKIIINTDGGSRGNPGEGAIGVVLNDERGTVIKRYGERIGFCTNNEAEYKALIFGLKKAKQIVGKDKIKGYEIEVRSDSELLVNQMNGKYKIQDEKIGKLFLEVWNLRVELPKIYFTVIKREFNKLADKMVNEALDGQIKRQKLF